MPFSTGGKIALLFTGLLASALLTAVVFLYLTEENSGKVQTEKETYLPEPTVFEFN